jgi:hypothetical protein
LWDANRGVENLPDINFCYEIKPAWPEMTGIALSDGPLLAQGKSLILPLKQPFEGQMVMAALFA